MMMKLLLLILFSCAMARAHTLTGKVTKVLSVDTLHILDASKAHHRVRLAGIVPPPSTHPLRVKAKKRLERRVLKRSVTVEWEHQEGDCDGNQGDEHCLKLGKVIVDVNTDVNLELIAMGMAKHDPAFRALQSTPDRTQYTEAEETARVKQRGVWSPKWIGLKKKDKKKLPKKHSEQQAGPSRDHRFM